VLESFTIKKNNVRLTVNLVTRTVYMTPKDSPIPDFFQVYTIEKANKWLTIKQY
jgi:hypothetical protein